MKKVIYLYRSGILQQRDLSLVLNEKNGNLYYLPIEQIDMIICFGEITLNKRVLSLLNKYGITLIFFNYYGNYIGRFSPKEYRDGKVLVNQVNCYQSNEKRLYIAKSMLESSLKNMNSLLKYYQKKGKQLNTNIEQIEKSILELNSSLTIENLLLIEAKAKQYYYSVFDVVLENERMRFIKRTKNPPKNEVNAMLSYGYALLYGVILAILDRSSLYPQISFIHSLSKNCDSLQFDIADIFKPVIIDRMVLRMIRKKQINMEHFEYKEDGRCYLNKEGIKVFSMEFDSNLKKTIMYQGKSYSYRSLLSKEVHNLSNYIKGTTDSYKGFIMKW